MELPWLPVVRANINNFVGSAAVNIYTPLMIGKLVAIIQSAITTGKITAAALNAPAIKLLILFALGGTLTFIDICLVTKLGESLSSSIKHELFCCILRQDISFFDQRMGGEIASRLTSDLNDFKHTFKLVIT